MPPADPALAAAVDGSPDARLLGRRPRRPARRVELAKAYGLADRGHGDPEHDRHAVRDRQRHEGPDRARGGEPDRGGRARARHHGPLGARRRPAARSTTTSRSSTCWRTGRASATTSTRTTVDDDHRLRDAGAGARARRRPRTYLAGARRPSRRRSPPGERFAYCNGGFVVLALIAERAERRAVPRAGAPTRVRAGRAWPTPRSCAPTSFRARAALGYLDGRRPRGPTCFHLPVRGSGDGGIYSTAADVSAFWGALFAGRIVSRGLGGRDGAAPQRRADGVDALRPRLLAPCDRATS